MADETEIGWAAVRLKDGTIVPGATFNGWIGCNEVSPGCAHCYARTQNAFYKWNKAGWGRDAARQRTSAAYWKKPLTWARQAKKTGRPRRIFCASLSDVFDMM